MRYFKTTYLFLLVAVFLGSYQLVEGRNILKPYPPIKGTVVDNATGKPLEGALVVAQWTKKHGFGLTYHTLSLITETLTEKEGVFSIAKTPNDPFVEPPQMIIYKEGYIPWRNDMVFPGGSSKLAKQHEWNNNVTYRLDVFTDKCTFRQLYQFMDSGIIGRGKIETPITSTLMRDISRREQIEIENEMRKVNKP